MIEDPTRRTLLWFRRQLRIDDQPLLGAVDPARDAVVAVWILDPRELLAEVEGRPRAGGLRLRFLLESVADLRESLLGRGVELLVRTGEPETILPGLCTDLGIDRLHFVAEPGTEERAVEREVGRVLDTIARPLAPESVLEIDDPVAFARDLPEVFSRFRRSAEKTLAWGRPVGAPSALRGLERPDHVPMGDIPTLSDLGADDHAPDPRGVLPFRGGETAGLERVGNWIFAGDHLRRYKETRNGLLGESYSSKFSPWLSVGAVSPRRIAAETLRYESERTANDSTYWLRFELLWREFFRLHLLKHGARLFRASGPADVPLRWGDSDARFEAWRSGRTGVPLVDANMRELESTGFMSNRGRQIVASFLAKNLDVDWRRGARWFEHCLLDACPAANWGNWAYAAGVGADPRGFRGFDVAKQARNYDPRGEYVLHWLPEELAGVPEQARHAPWTHGGAKPIVDPVASLDAARDRWEAANPSNPRRR